ncbi:hypothetical protein GLOTRDRAFT_131332 [Gloeophyllum trabeum ATCC 11539]|uniref:Uncharacterized protein n=1 Tax=Gloeophyllum trabeum (strain ATCC 11539 / FP-39264 / Madison 617) TaxID=670483 RepID=S7Q0N5_GLOTA|nr:uncharacterized protein GLOTRDRAFT_131332 [Gloeophyllum trabeum ATCC 11539]EPQ53047.1 hypothetical protein GLOTRDRAFT_131332 [Gloeophyllum trabeum ATCC 11539]
MLVEGDFLSPSFLPACTKHNDVNTPFFLHTSLILFATIASIRTPRTPRRVGQLRAVAVAAGGGGVFTQADAGGHGGTSGQAPQVAKLVGGR